MLDQQQAKRKFQIMLNLKCQRPCKREPHKCPRRSYDARKARKAKRHKVSLAVFKAVIQILKQNIEGLWIEDLTEDVTPVLNEKGIPFGKCAIRKVLKMLRDCSLVEWVRHAFVRIKPEYLGLREESWMQRVFFGNNQRFA